MILKPALSDPRINFFGSLQPAIKHKLTFKYVSLALMQPDL